MKKTVLTLVALVALASCAAALPPGAATLPAKEVRHIAPVPRVVRTVPPVTEHLPELAHTHTAACPAPSTEKVRVVCILDRSGSMQHLTGDTIGGYNAFIEKQRAEPGAAKVTTVLFDNRYETLYDDVPIADVKPLTDKEYFARGTTALLDAVAQTILRVDGEFKTAGLCPRAEPVIFMIMTDGLENASREFSSAAVKKLVSDAQENYGWKFIFMGANIDSVAEAGKIGIHKTGAMNYAATSGGVGEAFESADSAVKMFRARGSLDESWKKSTAPEQ